MPDQPEPSAVESGPVALQSVSGSGSTDQTSGDDGQFVSLEELKGMGYDDLKQFYLDNELTPPVEADNKEDLLDWLLSEFGVDA